MARFEWPALDKEEIAHAHLAATGLEITDAPGHQRKAAESLNAIRIHMQRVSPHRSIALLLVRAMAFQSQDGSYIQIDSDPLEQSQIEFLLGCLATHPGPLGKDKPSLDDIAKLKDLTKLYFMYATIGSFRVLEGLTNKQAAFAVARQMTMAHGMIIRNWAHHVHLVEFLDRLYNRFDAKLIELYGLSSKDIISIFSWVLKHVEKGSGRYIAICNRIARAGSISHILNALSEHEKRPIHPDEQSNAASMSLDELKEAALEIVTDQICRNFEFDIENLSTELGFDLISTSNLISQMLIKRGAADRSDLDLSVDNPAFFEQFDISGEGKYLSLSPASLFSHFHLIIGKLLSNVTEQDKSLARAEFLESETGDFLRRIYGPESVIESARWGDYETDYFVNLDGFCLIVECKSTRISFGALKGSDKRVEDAVKSVIAGGSIQSDRLLNKMEREGGVKFRNYPSWISFPGRENVCRITVTLDDFHFLNGSRRSLVEAGFLEEGHDPAIHTNIGDIAAMFDILKNPILITDFLKQRQDLPKNVSLSATDIQMLDMYLEDQFNGLRSVTTNVVVMTKSFGNRVSDYYEAIYQGIPADPPQVDIPFPAMQALNELCSDRPQGWITSGISALDQIRASHPSPGFPVKS